MSLDEAGRRLIAQRNGVQLGASMKLSAEDTALLSHVQTNRQARAVLGIIAQYLQRAYALTETMPHITQPGTGALAKGWKQTLDNSNRYAQKTYAAIPDDDSPLSDLNRRRLQESLREARWSLSEIGEQAADIDRGLTGTIADMLTSLLPSWLRPKDPKARNWILYASIGVAVLTGLFVAGKLIHTIVFGGTPGAGTLGEAEAAAVALMDAQRRRRRASRHG
jgi:hypothetical protein